MNHTVTHMFKALYPVDSTATCEPACDHVQHMDMQCVYMWGLGG
jgi:hypothetical protein